jgi:hypothetical protein
MTQETQILSYGLKARTRTWVKAVAIVLILAAAIAGYRYWVPLRSYVSEKYATWRYTRAFDRVAKKIDANSGIWGPVGSDSDDATALLQSLLAATRSGAWDDKERARNIVLFATFQMLGGHRVLFVAAMSPTSIEVYGFDREDRYGPYRTRSMRVEPFQDFQVASIPVSIKPMLKAIEPAGNDFSTLVVVNGKLNRIHWTSKPEYLMFRAWPRGSPLVVEPRTGWRTDDAWWPQTDDADLLTAPPETRILPATAQYPMIGFLGDDRVVTAGPGRLIVSRIDGQEPQVSGYPVADATTECVACSADGKLFFAFATDAAWSITDTSTGVRQYKGKANDLATPSFLSDGSLMLFNGSDAKILDYVSGDLQKLAKPADHTELFVKGGAWTAHAPLAMSEIRAFDTQGNARSFPGVRNLQQLSLSPDGRWLIVRGHHQLQLFETRTGKRVWENGALGLWQDNPVMQWSIDGRRAVVAGGDAVYVLSPEAPRWVARFPLKVAQSAKLAAALSADGRHMVALIKDPRGSYIYVWRDIDALIHPTK